MGWRWGGQESRKQEDSRQLVVPITAADTVGGFIGGEYSMFPLDSVLVWASLESDPKMIIHM